MRRYALPAVISLIVVALLAVLAFGVSKSGPSNVVWRQRCRPGRRRSRRTPACALALLGTAQQETLNELRGKVVMVNVFAGWCVACQDEVAMLKHAQQVLAQHGGELVGVTYQDSSSDAQGYLNTYHLHFPVLLDPGGHVRTALRRQRRAGDVHHRQGRPRGRRRHRADVVSGGSTRRSTEYSAFQS